MTPKEKARELVEKMNQPYRPGRAYLMTLYQKKQCALIAVDEILQLVGSDDSILITELQYWQEVKQEIEKL